MSPKDEVSHTVHAEPGVAGERVDRFLAGALDGLSRARIQGLIKDGFLAAGGETISDASRRVKPGEVYTLTVPAATPAAPRGQAIDLDVAYEDADIIVVDKPAGMVVHPAPGNPDHTLVNALIAHCGTSLSGIGGVQRPGIVHRLDKATSGLMVAAKNDRAHAGLSAQFADRSLSRVYLGVVWGAPAPPRGEIAGNIGRSRSNRKKMAVLARGGRAALTRYALRERLGDAASLVECRLATGRTHQIRVHLTSIGHPVIGDPVYGRLRRGRLATLGPAAREVVESFPRQALHACGLTLRHPASGESMAFESAIPADMADLIEALRGR